MNHLYKYEAQKIRSIQDNLLNWYKCNSRSFPWRMPKTSIFEKIVTEILLQRTKAETVSSIYYSFFGKFTDWADLANSAIKEIQEIIKPLGIWRRRSLVLKSLANEMLLNNSLFPYERAKIDKLPGVGQYVGNAIEMFCHNRPKPLLDTNMARVIERVFKPRTLADIRYDPWLQSISAQIVSTEKHISLNWALLDLGGVVCKPRNPSCGLCPLSTDCNYFKNNG